MPRQTYTERRRQRLARRVATLDAMEPRSMITEGLFSLGLGLGLAAKAAAHVGPRHAGQGHAKESARPAHRSHGDASTIPIGRRHAPQAGRGGSRPVAEAPTSKPAVVAPVGDWLTLAPAAPSPTLTPVSSAGPETGGGAQPSAGGAPDGPAAIRPVRFSPPPLAPGGDGLISTPPQASPGSSGSKASVPGTPPPSSSSPVVASPTTPPVDPAAPATDTTGSSAASARRPVAPLAPGIIHPNSGGLLNVLAIDYNDGTALLPGAAQLATPGGNVDLRAQVSSTSAVSYSWDTSGLTDAVAASITGASTYRLQFQWKSSIATAATDTVTLTVGSVVQTYTFLVPAGSGTAGTGTASWPAVVTPDTVEAGSEGFCDCPDHVTAVSGAWNAVVPLPAYNPNVPQIGLLYDSLAADPRPILIDRYEINPALSTPPATVAATLTLNGTTYSTYYYDTHLLRPGDILEVALQADATALSTGRYSYSITVGSTTTSGTMTVVNDSGSAFGDGWSLSGLDRIISAAGGVILESSGGDSLWFASGGGGYTTPAGDFSTLAPVSGGGYTRTFPDGTVDTFDASGYETKETDRNGRVTTYTYSSGKLSTIADPYGQVTSFAYSSGTLSTVTDPAGRVTTFTQVSGTNKQAGVTMPDSSTQAFAYDSAGRMTQVTDQRSKVTTIVYDSAERASQQQHPDGATDNYVAYQERGFVPSGSGTSLSPASPTLLAEARSTATDPNGHVTELRDDWRGLGVTNQTTDPLGNVVTSDLDANGLATIALDALSRYTTSSYDASGNLTGVIKADGGHITFTYNGFAKVTAATDENGHTTSYTYDAAGNNTVVEDALHNRITMTYTALGKVATVTDANLHTTSYQYDGLNRLSTVAYPAIAGVSATRLTAYDSQGDVVSVTDERGNMVTNSYDAMGRRTGITDALGGRTTNVYDSGGNLTQVQAPTPAGSTARTTNYAYDAMNRLVTATDPLSHATIYTYDSGGNLKTVTDPLGRTTTYAYDALDRLTTVTAPLSGGTTRSALTAYDADGEVIRSTDYMGRITTTTYNARGEVATVTDPLGNVTSYSYSSTGQLLTVSDPSRGGSVRISYAYDALDRLTTVIDALSDTSVTVYDPVGNILAQVDANGKRTTYAYDARDRATSVTDPLSHVTVTAYDTGSNVVSVTDPLSHAIQYALDALNRITTITDPRGAVTTMAFDVAGRQVGLTDPKGNRTTWAYDAADRMTTQTSPMPIGINGTSTYAYDNAGQLVGKTDRDGRRTTYAYDSGGRRINERWLDASGGTVEVITYIYDADDEVTGIADPNATLIFTYDSGGRQSAAGTSGAGSGQPAVTLTYGYDQLDEQTSVVDNLSSIGRITYSYDAAQRLTTISQSFGGTAGPRVVFGYDSGGRNTSVARTIGGSGTEIDTTLGYDSGGRLTTLAHQVNGGSALASYMYAYDNAGRVTTENYANVTVSYNYSVTYTYDSSNELTAAGGSRTEIYGYDSGGNRNTAGYATAAGNELTAAAGHTYSYDAEGNTVGQTDTATGSVTIYNFDYHNRLTGIVTKDSLGAVTAQATFTYDAINRRIGTAVDTDGSGPGSPLQTWTVFNAQNTYSDFDGSATLQTRYLYGLSADQLLARTTSGGASAWYLTDRMNSVRDISSTSNNIIDHIAYDSFGGIISETSSAQGDRFKFQSRDYDNDNKLYYNRARYYNPVNGRFTQQDPLGFASGTSNFYEYCGNDPINRSDPSGLTSPPSGGGSGTSLTNRREQVLGATVDSSLGFQRLPARNNPKNMKVSHPFSIIAYTMNSPSKSNDFSSLSWKEMSNFEFTDDKGNALAANQWHERTIDSPKSAVFANWFARKHQKFTEPIELFDEPGFELTPAEQTTRNDTFRITIIADFTNPKGSVYSEVVVTINVVIVVKAGKIVTKATKPNDNISVFRSKVENIP